MIDRLKPKCHPTRKHSAHGLCHRCYGSQWRREHRQHKRYYVLFRKYGITQEQYETLYTLQNGLCAICCGRDAKQPLSVDHCHKTGKIRGLLCALCNRSVELVERDPDWADKVKVYLRKDSPLSRGEGIAVTKETHEPR